MSIQFAQGKLKGEERKAVIQQIQQQVQEAALAVIRSLLTLFLEEELTAKLGREKGEPRRVSAQPRGIDWQCGQCGCSDANQFTRDGHDRRALATGWGQVEDLRVPMLECQQCQHDVICHYTILEKFQRLWLDLQQRALFGSGLSQSLRHLSQEWSATLGSSVGLRTINERINQLEPLSRQVHAEAISQAPAVVQFDGIWLTLQVPQDSIKPDKRQRQRHQRTGQRVVVLVALGFWEDGRRDILDWQIAKSEDQTEWETLLHRLWQRGLTPEKGLRAVVRDGNGGLGEAVAYVYGTSVSEQRCVFHKLRNVADKSREDLPGKDNKEVRGQLLEEVRTIYQAESAAQPRQRFVAVSDTWRQRAPKAVATLERDFEQTIAYSRLTGVAREILRTTSLLERTNRELRCKFRQAGSFTSRAGAEVAIYLQVRRLHARWANKTWWQVSHDLYFDLYNLNP